MTPAACKEWDRASWALKSAKEAIRIQLAVVLQRENAVYRVSVPWCEICWQVSNIKMQVLEKPATLSEVQTAMCFIFMLCSDMNC